MHTFLNYVTTVAKVPFYNAPIGCLIIRPPNIIYSFNGETSEGGLGKCTFASRNEYENRVLPCGESNPGRVGESDES